MSGFFCDENIGFRVMDDGIRVDITKNKGMKAQSPKSYEPKIPLFPYLQHFIESSFFKKSPKTPQEVRVKIEEYLKCHRHACSQMFFQMTSQNSTTVYECPCRRNEKYLMNFTEIFTHWSMYALLQECYHIPIKQIPWVGSLYPVTSAANFAYQNLSFRQASFNNSSENLWHEIINFTLMMNSHKNRILSLQRIPISWDLSYLPFLCITHIGDIKESKVQDIWKNLIDAMYFHGTHLMVWTNTPLFKTKVEGLLWEQDRYRVSRKKDLLNNYSKLDFSMEDALPPSTFQKLIEILESTYSYIRI